MGALPKRRISTRRKGKRRLSHSHDLVQIQACPQCSAQKLPHQVCPSCGFYKSQ